MRRGLGFVVVAAFAAACGSSSGGASPAPTAPPPSLATTPATASPPLTSPTATIASSAIPTSSGPTPLVGGPITPGDYTTILTGTTMTFSVEAPWIADSRPDVWSLADSVKGAMSVEPFVGKVFNDPCDASKSVTVPRSAASFIKQIQANAQLKVGKAATTKLAGHDAIQVDLTADVPPACPTKPDIYLWVLPTSGEFHLDENENARVIASDIDGKTFVVVLESLQGGDQAGLITATKPILDSLTVR